ncbi:MAG TPA: type I DNA topoisomerase [Chitinivibrionales bacterium]|jgi:DNA topoisomerase-1|nr:type I DNA topoisomerase [Chitinivibrionales bacterium]
MPKHLVIVESPAKCKTISKYLGKNYSVRATMGHIIDLPGKEFGVDIEHDFKPKYTVAKGKNRILKVLKDDAAHADIVYLAPDPDREGEAIAWHVAQNISKANANIKRVQFNEITKPAVLYAIAHPGEIDMNKVNAQQARRILDRIVGYQISPILWRTVFRGLSAGRVQSVALRLICEREDEIKAFVKREYWSIHSQHQYNGIEFWAKLLSVDGAKVQTVEQACEVLPNAAAAQTVIERVNNKPFTVIDVQRVEKSRRPYAPFITSTLQQEAARKLNFSATKTMIIAQQLYEGLELGNLGSMGLITYMRTDSTRIAQEALTGARKFIASQYGNKYLPQEPRVYARSKNAQDAHEAIRPSQVSLEFSPDKVHAYLSKDQQRLYELIWKRFLASQMENALYDSTRIDLASAGCTFRATGSIQKFDGFLALYEETTEEIVAENGEDENVRLPEVEVNATVALQKLSDKQHFTQPPPRYSEAALVRELEDKGIGRPSTYAQIIDTLKRRKYVGVDNKRFIPTEVGYMVKDILVKQFADVFDVGFTATMENSLDKVEVGEADWVSVLKDFYGPFSRRLEGVKANIRDLKAANQTITGRTCPECGKFPLVVKWSKNGKFLACQGFPACRYTEPFEKVAPQQSGEKCDKCGAPMVVLNINGNRFLGCSRYPDCRNTKSISTGVACPREGCTGQLIERKTKRGRLFFGCNTYPKCTFATWDRPVAKKCPHCGFGILVYKDTKRKGAYHRCPQCRTEYPIIEPSAVETP